MTSAVPKVTNAKKAITHRSRLESPFKLHLQSAARLRHVSSLIPSVGKPVLTSTASQLPWCCDDINRLSNLHDTGIFKEEIAHRIESIGDPSRSAKILCNQLVTFTNCLIRAP
jgi:hypothetical protein